MNNTFGGSSACTVVPIRETNNANAKLNESRILIPLFQMKMIYYRWSSLWRSSAFGDSPPASLEGFGGELLGVHDLYRS